MASSLTSLHNFLRNLINNVQMSQPRALLFTFLPTIILTPILYISVLDYNAWYSLGSSGVPHNIIGWLIQTLLRPFAKEPLNTACYSDPKTISSAGAPGEVAYLNPEDIPQRVGKRPEVGKWVVPHRLQEHRADTETKRHIQSFIQTLATTSPSLLKIQTSHLERHGPALYLCTTPAHSQHPVAHSIHGEIAHMHEEDGSLHVVLAPQDAKLVIERSWGQRHGLSGRGLWCGFLMVYAPRDEKERSVVEAIVNSGMAFMLAGSDKEK